MNHKKNISVVIPTLGSDSLYNTIHSLNSGTIKPHEILICIPNNYSVKIDLSIYDNVRILYTDIKGQVKQRLYGFENSRSSFVLQLDDDIILEKKCIENLLSELHNLNNKSAVSPLFYFKETQKPVYKYIKNNFLRYLFYAIINGKDGFKPGIICKSGNEIGVSPENIFSNQINTEWLPGGCVLHRKKI